MKYNYGLIEPFTFFSTVRLVFVYSFFSLLSGFILGNRSNFLKLGQSELNIRSTLYKTTYTDLFTLFINNNIALLNFFLFLFVRFFRLFLNLQFNIDNNFLVILDTKILYLLNWYSIFGSQILSANPFFMNNIYNKSIFNVSFIYDFIITSFFKYITFCAKSIAFIFLNKQTQDKDILQKLKGLTFINIFNTESTFKIRDLFLFENPLYISLPFAISIISFFPILFKYYSLYVLYLNYEFLLQTKYIKIIRSYIEPFIVSTIVSTVKSIFSFMFTFLTLFLQQTQFITSFLRFIFKIIVLFLDSTLYILTKVLTPVESEQTKINTNIFADIIGINNTIQNQPIKKTIDNLVQNFSNIFAQIMNIFDFNFILNHYLKFELIGFFVCFVVFSFLTLPNIDDFKKYIVYINNTYDAITDLFDTRLQRQENVDNLFFENRLRNNIVYVNDQSTKIDLINQHPFFYDTYDFKSIYIKVFEKIYNYSLVFFYFSFLLLNFIIFLPKLILTLLFSLISTFFINKYKNSDSSADKSKNEVFILINDDSFFFIEMCYCVLDVLFKLITINNKYIDNLLESILNLGKSINTYLSKLGTIYRTLTVNSVLRKSVLNLNMQTFIGWGLSYLFILNVFMGTYIFTLFNIDIFVNTMSIISSVYKYSFYTVFLWFSNSINYIFNLNIASDVFGPIIIMGSLLLYLYIWLYGFKSLQKKMLSLFVPIKFLFKITVVIIRFLYRPESLVSIIHGMSFIFFFGLLSNITDFIVFCIKPVLLSIMPTIIIFYLIYIITNFIAKNTLNLTFNEDSKLATPESKIRNSYIQQIINPHIKEIGKIFNERLLSFLSFQTFDSYFYILFLKFNPFPFFSENFFIRGDPIQTKVQITNYVKKIAGYFKILIFVSLFFSIFKSLSLFITIFAIFGYFLFLNISKLNFNNLDEHVNESYLSFLKSSLQNFKTTFIVFLILVLLSWGVPQLIITNPLITSTITQVITELTSPSPIYAILFRIASSIGIFFAILYFIYYLTNYLANSFMTKVIQIILFIPRFLFATIKIFLQRIFYKNFTKLPGFIKYLLTDANFNFEFIISSLENSILFAPSIIYNDIIEIYKKCIKLPLLYVNALLKNPEIKLLLFIIKVCFKKSLAIFSFILKIAITIIFFIFDIPQYILNLFNFNTLDKIIKEKVENILQNRKNTLNLKEYIAFKNNNDTIAINDEKIHGHTITDKIAGVFILNPRLKDKNLQQILSDFTLDFSVKKLCALYQFYENPKQTPALLKTVLKYSQFEIIPECIKTAVESIDNLTEKTKEKRKIKEDLLKTLFKFNAPWGSKKIKYNVESLSEIILHLNEPNITNERYNVIKSNFEYSIYICKSEQINIPEAIVLDKIKRIILKIPISETKESISYQIDRQIRETECNITENTHNSLNMKLIICGKLNSIEDFTSKNPDEIIKNTWTEIIKLKNIVTTYILLNYLTESQKIIAEVFRHILDIKNNLRDYKEKINNVFSNKLDFKIKQFELNLNELETKVTDVITKITEVDFNSFLAVYKYINVFNNLFYNLSCQMYNLDKKWYFIHKMMLSNVLMLMKNYTFTSIFDRINTFIGFKLETPEMMIYYVDYITNSNVSSKLNNLLDSVYDLLLKSPVSFKINTNLLQNNSLNKMLNTEKSISKYTSTDETEQFENCLEILFEKLNNISEF